MLDRAPNLAKPAGVDMCRAVLAYEGAGRELVARLKYRNARTVVWWLALEMARLVANDEFDLVTWIPTTAARRRQRGFDQAQLLARPLARALHAPCRPLLARRAGPPQTGRTGAERHKGPALSVRRGARVPARVLLVDDVITTGTSVAVAARALRNNGARGVSAIAAARTPLKRLRAPPETLVG
jgi:ComF family protein